MERRKEGRERERELCLVDNSTIPIKLFFFFSFLSYLKGSEVKDNGERGCKGAIQDQTPSAVCAVCEFIICKSPSQGDSKARTRV